MADIRRILCPVDFSDASRHALDHAAVIARWYGAAVTLLHVSVPVYVMEGPLFFAALPAGAAAEAADQMTASAVQAWGAPLSAAGLSADVVTEEGHDPAGRILACASRLPADLLVMGTHARAGLERLVLGSVTEKVLRKAPCPVLTVPPPAVRAMQAPFKRLLCPVDFSDWSLAALRFALSLAQESDARLTILHVLPLPGDQAYEPLDTPEFRLRCEDQARRRLDALVADEARQFCEPVTKLIWGAPYRRILEVADEEVTDVIVMGVHGRGIVDRLLVGSTTNEIVRHATCPVLTLRA